MTELKRITLCLARNPGYPEGDRMQGYVIVAPLDAHGSLDAAAWRDHKAACTVYRFHPDEAERADGWLSHRGDNWYFRYDEDHEGPDEPIFRLGSHRFTVGEYITVAHMGEDALTYHVADVTSAHA